MGVIRNQVQKGDGFWDECGSFGSTGDAVEHLSGGCRVKIIRGVKDWQRFLNISNSNNNHFVAKNEEQLFPLFLLAHKNDAITICSHEGT